MPIYPTAVFLDSYDAGRGQIYHLYGTDTTYDMVVTYYRNVLRDGGRQIYEQPAIRQFDLGRFRENQMAFPPSVVVKDYRGSGAAGYPFVSGTTETRYATVIQVVLPDPADR